MRRRDVERELLDQPRQPRRLSLGKLEHQPRQGRRVDDRVLERALQAPADEPRVECVVAVLDEHGAVSESQEGTPRVAKLRRPDEHRAVDVVAPVRVRVDRRLAVHERVEERQRAVEAKPLGADLEDEKRRVPGGLDVQRYELRFIKPCLGANLGGVDRDLLPGHRLHGPAWFEKYRVRPLAGAHLDSASARRAQLISSLVNPRSRRTAAP
jgi:hypothetical protein